MHQKALSPISEHVLPDQVAFGSIVCQFGSSTQPLGEALGMTLGMALGVFEIANDGRNVGTALGSLLGGEEGTIL